MKKLESHYKKHIRNLLDTQVKKYKQDLDTIGIRYDDKSAHVEIPKYDGGFEYFKWNWMTSTTHGKHSPQVSTFKDIVRVLKEAKSNTTQYENLVSNLNASNKNALEATIKSNNITVTTQQASQEKLVEKALAEAKRSIEVNNVTAEFKNYFSKMILLAAELRGI